MQGAPIEHVTRALVNRGFALNLLGESMRAIADFTAVIGLPGAPVEQVAKALLNRGAAQGMAGDPQREIADYTAVIGLPGAPIKLVAIARYLRGVNHLEGSRKQLAEADLRALISLPEVRLEMLADAQLSLAEILCSEGQWSEGFQGLAASLRCAAKVPTANLRSATGLIGVVFSAGLNPEGRREKVTKLLRIYAGHNSLAVLGEAVIQHVGTVYRSGAPFPSTDNLEGWASAWEQAAGSEPDFRLSVRLLRTGIDFVKSGGKDRGILLTLTSPERAILQQALGLAARGEAETS